jgi:hypothetical protein
MASDNTPDQPDPERGFDWDRAERDLSAPTEVSAGVDPGAIPGQREALDGSFSVALDDEPEPGPYLAPPPPPGAPGEGTRLPILPAWARSRQAIRAQVRRVVGRWLHTAGYHAVRSPMYAALGAWYASVGLFRLAGRQLRWWWLSEQEQLRQAAATANDPDTWHKLHREARHTRRWRAIVLAAEALTTGLGITLLLTLAPAWVIGGVLAVVVPVLAHIGRGSGRPIIDPAVITPRFRTLTYDVVLRAYYAAGLGHPDRPNMQVQFAPPGMSRDAAGLGSQVTVDLPYGKGYGDVLKAKEAIASGLDVSVNQVFFSRDNTSNRRHVLYVADRDPLAIPAGRSPLLDGKVRDIWDPAPLGLDERGRKVELLLLWISILVGAQPRKGKTFFARMVALCAALDPYVRMLVVDGKMSPDWDKFRLVAHRMVVGTVPNSRDANPVENLLVMLREVKAHIQEVNEFLSKLPVDECPEGKLTRELSRKYPQLRVWMLVMEEFQNYYETDDQDVNKEIAGLLSYIMAVGPSAGVILLSSTQKPSGVGAGDVQRLFNRFRDNHAVRFALKCGNRVVSESILGGDAYAEGFDASALPAGKDYRGVGLLYGASDDTPVVRSYLADHVDAERILQAARKHRQAAGTLSGMAAGEAMQREVRDALADVRAVFNPGETGLHWPTIAIRLAERIPEHYADITADAVSAQLRPHVPSVNVKVGGEVLKGARLKDVDAAIDRRRATGER